MDRLDSCDRGWESPDGASSEESHMAGAATAADAKRTCTECGTSKTPLWRSGPAGPKSLCNACGIRSRKKRRAILGLEDKKPKKISPGSTKNNSASSGDHRRGVELRESLKRGILAIGKHVAMPRSRKKVGGGEEEEEQAAMLLMALSYGSVYFARIEKTPVEMRGAK